MRKILALLLAGVFLAAAGPCPMGPGVPCPSVRQITIPLTTSIPSGWPFTRVGNTATLWQAGALVGPVAANVARFPTNANNVPLGLQLEPTAINTYLNSQAPATQTITVAAVAYTLSFYGTGTIALTGTYTGALSGTGAGDLVQLTFTPSAGALIATLTGSVTNVQLEAGSFATSRIITASASVTRNSDNLIVALSAWPWQQTPQGDTWAGRFSVEGAPTASGVVWGANDGTPNNYLYVNLNSSGQARCNVVVGGSTTSSSYISLNALGTQTFAISRTRSGIRCSINRGAVVAVTKAGLPAYTVEAWGRRPDNGSSYAAINVISQTLRAGPSNDGWLQAGNY
jgi:hypothetical protein